MDAVVDAAVDEAMRAVEITRVHQVAGGAAGVVVYEAATSAVVAVTTSFIRDTLGTLTVADILVLTTTFATMPGSAAKAEVVSVPAVASAIIILTLLFNLEMGIIKNEEPAITRNALELR